MTEIISSFKELRAYQEAVRLQGLVFEESKLWPKEELYALTSQIRRSSRAIGAAMAEAWAKRRYPAHFLSKMSDADAELQESQHWIDTAYASGYLSGESKESFILLSHEIGKMIGGMMAKHESFCHSSSSAETKWLKLYYKKLHSGIGPLASGFRNERRLLCQNADSLTAGKSPLTKVYT